MKMVFEFNEGSKNMLNLLGGKGANLCEMTKMKLPIPYGIIISTDACRKYFEDNCNLDKELENEILNKLSIIEKKSNKQFQGKNPLLVSVRSGAPISMPGMMDTILNLGFNDEVAKNLIEIFGDKDFVYNSYARFIQMFSEIAMGIDRKYFSNIEYKNYEELIDKSKKIYREKTGDDFPEDFKEQILIAVNSIFNSWNNERAILYRKLNNIDDNMGTAVVIQEMVFGNFNELSGTGVLFSRNPSNGENEIFGEYLIRAQGEDIVAGIRTPESISTLKNKLPKIYDELNDIAKTLEKYNKDMQDIEFTIENNKLFILQTRNGKRSAKAAVKIAVDLVSEGLITKEEAISKIDAKSITQLMNGDFDKKYLENAILLGKGVAASSGVAVGRIMFDAKRVKIREKTILVREETSPEDLKGMALSQGILTTKGGATSHGAVVARGMGKCCVTGCIDIKIDEVKREMYAGNYTLKEGDFISISGYTGEIFLGKIPMSEASRDENLEKILEWAKEIKRLDVRMNADTPEDVRQGKAFGAKGIGLCRTEHMFFKGDKIFTIREILMSENDTEKEKALKNLYDLQTKDFFEIFKELNGDIANIRLLDPPIHEFLPKNKQDIEKMSQILNVSIEEIEKRISKLKDANPMLGHRGCRLAISYPDIYKIQGKAIIDAAIKAYNIGIKVDPEIMIPFVMDAKELAYIRKEIEEEIKKSLYENKCEIKYQIGTMIEIPRACLIADEIAKYADFFSFGTNDLTQMSMGLSRDDSVKFLEHYREKGIWDTEPFYSIDNKAVTRLVEIAVNLGRQQNKNLEIGICGEHGGDPDSIDFFEKVRLDYISCSPFRIPVAILSAAQSAIKYKNN